MNIGHFATGGDPRPTLSVEDYRDQVVAMAPAPWTKPMPLGKASDRTLAEDVRSRVDIPGFDNSAMDGYAVRSEEVAGATSDTPVALPVAQDIPAGHHGGTQLTPGSAARIMTGAPIPPGADAVVPWEDTEESQGVVSIRRAPRTGAHIRKVGEDTAAGTVIVTAGRRLRPAELAAAAAAGYGEVLVARRPRVAVVTTGDELTEPGETPPAGGIFDSNGPYLVAAVREAGGRISAVRRSPDRREIFEHVLDEVAPGADLVVLAGGISAGTYDVVRETLVSQGGVAVHVRMQPGKPQGYGRWRGGTPIVALPGNPVSVAVSFAMFVRPFIDSATGRARRDDHRSAKAAASWSSPQGRRQYVPVTLSWRGSELLVAPATPGGSRSHLVTSLALADALAVVPEEVTRVSPGDLLSVVPL